jgi:hypothetical protein
MLVLGVYWYQVPVVCYCGGSSVLPYAVLVPHALQILVWERRIPCLPYTSGYGSTRSTEKIIQDFGIQKWIFAPLRWNHPYKLYMYYRGTTCSTCTCTRYSSCIVYWGSTLVLVVHARKSEVQEKIIISSKILGSKNGSLHLFGGIIKLTTSTTSTCTVVGN